MFQLKTREDVERSKVHEVEDVRWKEKRTNERDSRESMKEDNTGGDREEDQRMPEDRPASVVIEFHQPESPDPDHESVHEEQERESIAEVKSGFYLEISSQHTPVLVTMTPNFFAALCGV